MNKENSSQQYFSDKPPDTQGINSKKGIINQWAFEHRKEEPFYLLVVRTCLRVCLIMMGEFTRSGITLRASALTFSVMLSLIPLLAMSTAVLKGLGKDDQLKIAAYKFIDSIDPDNTKKNTESPAELTPDLTNVPGEPPLNEKDLVDHLRSGVDTIFSYVNRTNFATLGAFGIVGLLYAVILVLSTIEESMNAIWHTKRGRSLFRKIMDYLALLILLPVSINVALAGDAVLASPKILAYLNTFIPSAWAVTMLLKLIPFIFVVLSLMVMYLFFPNVKVHTYAAFSGAIFAAASWLVVQKFYIFLQVGVSKYNAIYGSFATLPLFLIWMQLGWMFILLGASLAYAVQHRNLYHLPGTKGSPKRKLQLAFDVLETVYSDFTNRRPSTFDSLLLAHNEELPADIQDIIDTLTKGALLHRLQEDPPIFFPAAPPDSFEAKEVVRLFLGTEETPTPGGLFSTQVIEAAEAAIKKDAFPRGI